MEELPPHSMPHAKGVQIGDGNVQYNVSGHSQLRLSLDEAAYSSLTDLLSALPAVADVPLLFRTAGGGIAGATDPPSDPQRCVDLLRTYVDTYPLFAFVEHLAAGCRDPMRRQLRSWVDDNIGEIRQPERRQQLASVRADADRDAAGLIGPQLITVRLDDDLLTPGRYLLTVLHAHGGAGPAQVAVPRQPLRLAEVSRVVADLIGRHTAHDTARVPARLTFVVPDHLVAAPFEQWQVPRQGAAVALGTCCIVTVRPTTSPPARDAQAEVARWRRTLGTTGDADGVTWVDDVTDVRPGEAACVAVIGDRLAGQPAAVVRLLRRLNCNVAIWHRGRRIDRRSALRDVLGGRPLADLPRAVRAQRAQAAEPDAGPDHPGHDVVLLWDDPEATATLPSVLQPPKPRKAHI